MDDSKTTIGELKALVEEFVNERDWKQFHDPKNLAEGLSIEASELMEHFLWKHERGVAAYLEDANNLEEVGDELADVFNYTLQLSLAMKIDITQAVKRKLGKNALKYPIEKAKGKAVKYTKL